MEELESEAEGGVRFDKRRGKMGKNDGERGKEERGGSLSDG